MTFILLPLTRLLGLWLLLFCMFSTVRGKDVYTQAVSRSDLLSVIPSSISRLALVKAGRQWRKGVRTFVASDEELPKKMLEGARLHRETWATFKDIKNSDLVLGPRQGDLRAAMAPFLANVTHSATDYKWIMYGDDDTVFFVDNVISLVSGLDYRKPYFISDCLWFPQGGNGVRLHPNNEAPRCLPCGYRDPLLYAGGMCPGQTGFIPAQGCPCTPEQIMEGHWVGGEPKFSDGRGVFDRVNRRFVSRPDDPNSPNVGWWWMIHGGAGALISRGAMQRASFEAVKAYLTGLEPQSGDAMLTKAFWDVLNLAPTDPGYGVCRKHIQMFDPGWKGPRARGPEDAGTLDGGADPSGVIHRLHQSLEGKGCDEECEDQLMHTITVHVRSRYAAGEMHEKRPYQAGAEDGPPLFRAACHLIRKLAGLSRQHAAKVRGRDGFIPLWDD